MKSILTFLTSALVAAQAFATGGALDETPNSPSPQSAAQAVAASAEASRAAFEKAAAEMNRAARENDLDAMRALVDDALKNDALTTPVKAELVETLCSAQVKEFGQRGDEAALRAYCQEFVAQASQIPAYAACATNVMRLVAVYNPSLGEEFDKAISNSVYSNAKPEIRQAAINHYSPAFRGSTPQYDPAILDVAPGGDRESYREQLAKVVALRDELRKRVAADPGSQTPRLLLQKTEVARRKLLREIVLSKGDNTTRQFDQELQDYVAIYQTWRPQRLPSDSDQGLTAEDVELAIKELKEKGLDQFGGPDVMNLERTFYQTKTQDYFDKALRGADAERDAFLAYYRARLDDVSNFIDSAPGYVSLALDSDRPDLAEGLARVVEEYRQAAPEALDRRAYLASVRRALNRGRLDSLVGQKLELSGVDVDYKETTLEAYRGKTVLIVFAPRNSANFRFEEEAIRQFDAFVQTLDPEKFAALEYAESTGAVGIGTRADMSDPNVQKTLDALRAKPYPVIAQDLSIRANVAFDADYPAFFRSYRIPRMQFALVDPDGVLRALEPEPRRIQRRLQLQSEKANSADVARQDVRE